jgi:myo-inositol 2-dehydrogenase/D-chiro-inositol 1-dehydrogenase
MAEPLKIAVAGLGRMGSIHALHAHELARDTQNCELVALAEPDSSRARRFLSEIGRDLPVFPSVDELAKSGVCNAAVIVTPTDNHREHAGTLISAGYRVLLEKPLTGALEADRAFAQNSTATIPTP